MDINELCINCFKPTGGEEVCMNCGYVQSERPKQLVHLYPHTILKERYIIGAVVNNGGFGVVYKAYDIKLESIVAIKELLPTQNGIVNRIPGTKDVIPVNEERAQQFEKLKQRFLDEARTMAQFSGCESIVHVFDFFEENNTAYLVMEYLDGKTLREYLDENDSKMPFDDAMKIILPVMKALKTVHKKNIIHRDVSPDNIFICNDNKVKLIDFGAARFSDTEKETNYSVVMKPGYTPPEQYRTKGKIGSYTDIYSVGAVLYTILSGQMPEESIDRMEKDNLQKPSKLGVELPVYAEKSIMKAMALRENARFKTMNDFILAVQGKKKADYPEVELKKKKIIRAVSVALIFALLAASVIVTYQIKNSGNLIPSKSTTITLWYIDDSATGLNERWETISEEFEDFVKAQGGESLSVKLEVVGYTSDEYDEMMKKAFVDKTIDAPDIFESSNPDYDEYCTSLDNLYSEFESSEFKSAFNVMKDTYSGRNKIAVCYDMPVLYTYTDYSYIGVPDSQAQLNDLQNSNDGSDKHNFSCSLTCSSNAVLYASYAYGYKGKSTEVVTQLFDDAVLLNENKDLFVNGDARYYIGMMSEYSSISAQIRAGQESFDVSALTGEDTKDYYIFPEVWSVSTMSSANDTQASKLLLYFLMSTEDGQEDITVSDSSTYYLPMYAEAVNNLGYNDYKNLYKDTENGVAFSADEAYSVSKKAEKIAELVQNPNNEETDNYKEISSILGE